MTSYGSKQNSLADIEEYEEEEEQELIDSIINNNAKLNLPELSSSYFKYKKDMLKKDSPDSQSQKLDPVDQEDKVKNSVTPFSESKLETNDES